MSVKFKDGDRVVYVGPPANYPWCAMRTGTVIGDSSSLERVSPDALFGIRFDLYENYLSGTDYHDTPPWEYYKLAMGEDLDNFDPIDKPPHYTLGDGIECIDYMKQVLSRDEYIGYLRGCMIKYQHRMNYKDTPQSNASKARWYAQKLEEAYKEKYK